jgi:hypothetical protein
MRWTDMGRIWKAEVATLSFKREAKKNQRMHKRRQEGQDNAECGARSITCESESPFTIILSDVKF